MSYMELKELGKYKNFKEAVFIVNKNTGDVIKGISDQTIVSSDAQIASRVILEYHNIDNALFYPLSLKTRYGKFRSENIAKLESKEVTIDGDNYTHTMINNIDGLYCLETGRVIDLHTFDSHHVLEIINIENKTNQEIAHWIMNEQNPNIQFYTKSTRRSYLFDQSNLARIDKSDPNASNNITVNDVKFIRIGDTDKFVSRNNRVYDIITMKFDNDFKVNSEDPQALARDILKTETEDCYPKRLDVQNLFAEHNLRKVQNDQIVVNKMTMHRCKRHPNLFISYKLQTFDISTFKMVEFDVTSEYKPQEICQIIKHSDKLFYPKSLRRASIYKPDNLYDLASENKSINVNLIELFRHPRNPNKFISYKFDVFDIIEFTLTVNKDIINDFTAQEFAQLIWGKNEILYPKRTTIEYIFEKLNLDPVNDESMYVNKIAFYKVPGKNIIKSADNYVLDLTTFKLEKMDPEEFNESVQDICRRLTGEQDTVFVPKSMRGKNKLRKENIGPIRDENIIDNVMYTRHPYFNNIIGSNKCKLIDIDTFKVIEKPTIEMLLPFINKEYVLLDEDAVHESEYVYNRMTNTINNQEIDWTDLKKTTPISLLRYYHPDYTEYFCDFYGRIFKNSIDVDTGLEHIKEMTTVSVNFITIIVDGRHYKKSIEEFDYECYNNVSGSEHGKIGFVKEYPKAGNKFRFCKWNLIETKETTRININENRAIKIHPFYDHYGWDVENNCAFSLYSNNYINSKGTYITVNRNIPNNMIPINRFKYECINNTLLRDDEFMINDTDIIKIGTRVFTIDDSIFRITKNPLFYKSDDNKVFYVKYQKIVPVKDGTIIISRHHPENNVKLYDIV